MTGPAIDLPWTLANTVLSAVVNGWDGGAEPLPERQYVTVGEVAWDCEEVVVSIERTFGYAGDLSVDFNQPLTRGFSFALRGVTLAIWIVRCFPAFEDDAGDPPTTTAIEAATQPIATDSGAILSALIDSQKAGELAGCDGLVFENWTVEGPQGGMAAGVLRVRIGFI